MRCTAAMLRGWRARIQCFVDDPLIVVAGGRHHRRRVLACILLLWSALEYRLSWAKGSITSQPTWIGARFHLIESGGCVRAVSVTIAHEKQVKLAETLRSLGGARFVERRALKEFAGFVGWVASVVPSMRPFGAVLWAAASARPAGAESPDRVERRRVDLAFRWLAAFADGRYMEAPRVFPLDAPAVGPRITFDASLTGGGAVLDLPAPGDLVTESYFAAAWTPADHRRLGVRPDDPAAQPLWEAYALLIAIAAWADALRPHAGVLTVRGDAQGVLQAAVYRRARRPDLNLLIAEMSLRLSGGMHDILGAHWWSEQNAECDALSRLHEGAALPERLAGVKRLVHPPRARWALFRGTITARAGEPWCST